MAPSGVCRSTQEAQRAYSDLSQLLTPTGMQLKGTAVKTVHDLGEGAVAEWLGFELSKGESGLRVSITEGAWKSLAERLELAQTEDGSPLRAIETINGWISQMGPWFSQTNISFPGGGLRELAPGPHTAEPVPIG
jgi:hypothetical protein